jgi:hypothetical protein
MSYDLHITRADHWTEAEAHPIRRDEAIALVEADPELSLAAAPSGGAGDPDQSNELDINWSGANLNPCLIWSEGSIQAFGPEGPLRAKMFRIAERLGANLIGDDGERYASEDDAREAILTDPDGGDPAADADAPTGPDAGEPAEPVPLHQRPWAKILAGLILLAIVIALGGGPLGGSMRSMLVPIGATIAVLLIVFIVMAILQRRSPGP